MASKPEVRVSALQRPLAEEAHLLVEAGAEAADGALADAREAELGHEAVDLARRDAVHVGLLDDGDQGLLAAAARLEEAGEVAARAQPRDGELDLAGAGLPAALAVAVAVRGALRALLVQTGADLLRDLGLHQLACEPGERLAQHVGVLIAHELAHKLVERHALLGHRGAPLVVSLQRMRRFCSPRWPFSTRADCSGLTPHYGTQLVDLDVGTERKGVGIRRLDHAESGDPTLRAQAWLAGDASAPAVDVK